MPSLTAQDRAPLCLFSYEDGRRCRTPRTSRHPHFCFYHAQKESQSQAAEKLSEDLAYFFSGDYISANDLSTALSRLIPAVVRGEIKPRLARTLAYMFQIQLQAIHLSQREYVNAFGADGWRKALRSSVTSNADYLYPPNPAPVTTSAPAEFDANRRPESPAEPAAPPAQSCHPVYPACPEERREERSERPSPPPAPFPARHAERSEAPRQDPTPPITDETHRPVAATSPQASPNPNPATPSQTAQTADPTPPPQPHTPRRQPGAPTRDPYAVHFDHNYRLIVDGKPW
jgi:hypothetical protein